MVIMRKYHDPAHKPPPLFCPILACKKRGRISGILRYYVYNYVCACVEVFISKLLATGWVWHSLIQLVEGGHGQIISALQLRSHIWGRGCLCVVLCVCVCVCLGLLILGFWVRGSCCCDFEQVIFAPVYLAGTWGWQKGQKHQVPSMVPITWLTSGANTTPVVLMHSCEFLAWLQEYPILPIQIK